MWNEKQKEKATRQLGPVIFSLFDLGDSPDLNDEKVFRAFVFLMDIMFVFFKNLSLNHFELWWCLLNHQDSSKIFSGPRRIDGTHGEKDLVKEMKKVFREQKEGLKQYLMSAFNNDAEKTKGEV